jgi:hypothetical protein
MRNISFIILCPLLGYKESNKRHLKLDVFNSNIKKIQESFTNPDIVVVTSSKYIKEYEEFRPGFRICENQIYYDSGEIEQIRLGLNNIANDKIIILKEDAHLDFKSIKNNMKTKSPFITVGSNTSNPGMVIEKGLVYNISFGINNYFGDVFYVDNFLNEVKKFSNKPHNINKKMHEMINFFINNTPIRVIN